MNIALILKYIAVTLIFMALGIAEGKITNPPPSQESIAYQQHYDIQANKGSLTQNEFESLKNKGEEYFNSINNDNQLGYLLTAKLSFALLLLFTAFVICKYMFTKTTLVQVGFSCAACTASLILFTSTLELIVYVIFCIAGSLIGKKYNNAFKRDAEKAPRPLT